MQISGIALGEHIIMLKTRHVLSWLCLMALFNLSKADVGTATSYNPPYIPSACYGNDRSKFPSNNLFASAGEGIWDNGASCGRQYQVRCLSAATPNTCIAGKTVQVEIVDRAASSVSRPVKPGTVMVLNVNAYAMIANPSVSEINIEYIQP
ncbi:EG45-like domain-containing protein [Cinnamomum micranthum f. kanehirae]|uniref:EG45-like domain-containing protein n=2 Tax=Cinnamomum micranthum f. kanehirae TaxID=337451 RepID=A0A3S3PUJ0_9MAGN|nr:EG45-like domain-containing protein [Cinnamomum micranthum f. kanehirae]